MINLNELQQFVSFADCGTLVGAAAVLHLSQPALSRNMRNLEKELGITIVCTQEKPNRIEREREICIESSKKSVS